MPNTIPQFIHRSRCTAATVYNQKKILELAKSNKLIFLNPIPARTFDGHIEHYYHFIFDLILPLFCLIKKTPADVIFLIKDFGIYTDRLEQLFPGRIKIENEINIPKNTKRISLIGMNPTCVQSKNSDIESFKNELCTTFKIDQNLRPNKILLIERLPPDPYFIMNASIKGGGSSRRSILNHDELASILQSMVRAPFEFHNIQLEKVPFPEQIQFFNRAIMVIGQHGAGLANCIWMKRQSMVVELGSNKSLKHFRIISKFSKHHYFWYKTSGPHTTINIKKFSDWILSDPKLRTYFNHL